MGHEVAWVLTAARLVGLGSHELFPTCLVDVGDNKSHHNGLEEKVKDYDNLPFDLVRNNFLFPMI